MLRPNKELAKILESYVCVRVTDMSDVNLEKFQFDYDLTFALTIHDHRGESMSRFGGRNETDANLWQQPQAIIEWLTDCLSDHQFSVKYKVNKVERFKKKGYTIRDIPAFAKRVEGKKKACVHCHSLFPAFRRELISKKTWNPAQKFVFPDPKRIGLQLDPIHQKIITSVQVDSAAHKIGLAPGDRLFKVGGISIHSIADIQYALHKAPEKANELQVEWYRQGESKSAKLVLTKDWKECTPWEYSWRPIKWELSPAPGFGGKLLSKDQKQKHGIKDDAFAMRIDYLVTWGHRAKLGRNAQQAGLRKGDIVLSLSGKSDFKSGQHFHSWVRLKCKVGQILDVEIWRQGKINTIKLKLPDG